MHDQRRANQSAGAIRSPHSVAPALRHTGRRTCGHCEGLLHPEGCSSVGGKPAGTDEGVNVLDKSGGGESTREPNRSPPEVRLVACLNAKETTMGTNYYVDERMRQSFEMGETTAEFVKWLGEKYELTPARSW
jgi:hypothetical protein